MLECLYNCLVLLAGNPATRWEPIWEARKWKPTSVCLLPNIEGHSFTYRTDDSNLDVRWNERPYWRPNTLSRQTEGRAPLLPGISGCRAGKILWIPWAYCSHQRILTQLSLCIQCHSSQYRQCHGSPYQQVDLECRVGGWRVRLEEPD